MDKRFARFGHHYDVTLTNSLTGVDYPRNGCSRAQAAGFLRIARSMPERCTIKIVHRTGYYEAVEHACFGCLARPALWEMDCDGWYCTASCGQCDWSAAVDLRERATI